MQSCEPFYIEIMYHRGIKLINHVIKVTEIPILTEQWNGKVVNCTIFLSLCKVYSNKQIQKDYMRIQRDTYATATAKKRPLNFTVRR